MTTDATDVTRWKQNLGLQKRGVQWDTTMSNKAGEGKEWIQLEAQGPLRKKDVTSSLLSMMRQPTEKKTEKGPRA